MSDEHEFEIEPVRGLPEALPQGEHILWQGAPSAWALARDAMSLYYVAGYFVLIALWRAVVHSDAMTMIPYLILGLITCAILLVMALIFARTTVYTITNKRVGMRIGAALNVTLNIPFTQIANANLMQRSDGTGTIALEAIDDTKISYLVCWPHVRPWHIRKTQPALRSIPNAEAIATLLGDAAHARVTEATRREPNLHAMPAE